MAEWVAFIENALEEGKSVRINYVGKDICLEPHQTVEIDQNEEYMGDTLLFIRATSEYKYESINKIKRHIDEYRIFETSIICVSTSVNEWEEIK